MFTGKAHTRVASLGITANLSGRYPNKTAGEVYIDFRNHPPEGMPVPLTLQGIMVRCWLWLPRGSAGKCPSAPNGVQLFVKSEGWWSWYSRWINIQPQWEETWVEVVVSLSDPPGYKDPQFDPTKIIALGLKVAINGASNATLSGVIYLDDYVLETNPPIPFDFEHLEVERDVIALRQVLATCALPAVRAFVFGDGRAAPDFSSDGKVVGFDEYVFQDFDTLLTTAQQQGLSIIPVLLDFWWCDKASFENGVQLRGHSDIIRDLGKRQTFLDHALKPFLQRYRNHPQILAWEVMNEPEWTMDEVEKSFEVGDPVTVNQMQEFVRICAQTIHTYTPHQVTVGSARLPWLLEYWKGVGLDLYQFYWYDQLGDAFPWPAYAELGLNKPCLIGEVPTANTAYSTMQYLQTAYERGYYGALVWSYRAADAFSDFSRAAPDLARWCTSP